MKVQDEIISRNLREWSISVTSVGQYHLTTDVSMSNAPGMAI
jgi:hypothetical protein